MIKTDKIVKICILLVVLAFVYFFCGINYNTATKIYNSSKDLNLFELLQIFFGIVIVLLITKEFFTSFK